MTPIKNFLTPFCFFMIVSCSGSEDNLPTTPVENLSETKLADFNFSSNVEYMEKRYFFHGDELANYQVSDEFDSEIKATLTETQLSNIQQATTSAGIGLGCLPQSCTFYFVTLEQEVAIVIDNDLDLETLIGDVDTPAELHLVLLNSKYHPKYYQVIANGFRVVARWSDCNGGSGEDLLEIDRAGNIVLIKEIEKEQNNTVC
ncbi:MAG: hypothetical protein ACI88A_001841 [Paraglaciecola sp.]|jgi:hypothetical protein